MAEEIKLYDRYWPAWVRMHDVTMAKAGAKRAKRKERNLELLRKGALQPVVVEANPAEELMDEKLAELIVG